MTPLANAGKRSHNHWTAGEVPSSPVVMTPLANAGSMGSIPGLETKVQHAVGYNQKKVFKVIK